MFSINLFALNNHRAEGDGRGKEIELGLPVGGKAKMRYALLGFGFHMF